MDAFDVEAMIVRHAAATRLLRDGEEDGPTLLLQIVAPGDGLRAASRQEAIRRGVSLTAMSLYQQFCVKKETKAGTMPDRLRHRPCSASAVTLDELLTQLA